MLSTATRESKEIIALGDLNVNYLVKSDHIEIKEMLKLNGLKQLVTKPTRYDLHHNPHSLIDIILVSNQSSITITDVIPMSIGDHDMIGCVQKINNVKFSARAINCRARRVYAKIYKIPI